MRILTEQTPNPDAMRFEPDRRLLDGASASFERGSFQADWSPLAARLFAIPGVGRVHVAPEFVTVVREPGGPDWAELKPQVVMALADHLDSDEAAVAAHGLSQEAEAAAGEIDEEIRQVLGLHVRPAVARDGGEILLDRFDADSGVLWIRMQGACGGCPSAGRTLRDGVERIVRRYVPEVLAVREVQDRPPASPAPSPFRRWMSQLAGPARPGPRTVFTHKGRAIASGGEAER